MSSESDPEDLDLDLLNEIKVEANDIDELDRLISTTKNQFCILISIKKQKEYLKSIFKVKLLISS